MRGDLTQGRLREVLKYDPYTGEFRWLVALSPKGLAGAIAGTILKNGYRHIQIDGTQYLAHRLVWLYVYGRWPEADVDHEDKDRDGNWLNNLREATRSQNCANIRRHRDSASPMKGVHLSANRLNPWRAQIKVRGALKRLGYFPTPEAAHAAYCEAAAQAFGAFANGG